MESNSPKYPNLTFGTGKTFQNKRKEIPMLFSGPMVDALINDTKFETRRMTGLVEINKNPNKYSLYNISQGLINADSKKPETLAIFFKKQKKGVIRTANHKPPVIIKCPYGNIGDVIWVRETWALTQPFDPETYYFTYKAYNQLAPHSKNAASDKYDYSTPDVWKPSIHMPKEAARIFLEITDIKCERLQDITRSGAINEGIMSEWDGSATWFENYGKSGPTMFKQDPVKSYKSLWEKINGINSWNQNPWVWVIKFKKVKGNGTR